MRYLKHLLLFLLTVFTTLMVGAEFQHPGHLWGFWRWVINPETLEGIPLLGWKDLGSGITYSVAFLTFLTVHEFGHYFTSLYHRVRATLPFYIPFYLPIPGALNIGSLGAVIRIRQMPDTTRKFFDIGIAGPLAGFVVSLFLIIYGLLTLPPQEEYLLAINPDYVELFGGVPDEATLTSYLEANGQGAYKVGTSLLLEFLKVALPVDKDRIPTHFDIIHYPFLFVGFLTLFFTALNLLPIGQLDGGHVTYGLFGRKRSGIIGRFAVFGLLILGGTGAADIRPLISPSPEDLAVGDFWYISPMAGLAIYAIFLVFVFSRIFGKRDWRLVALPALLLFLAQVMAKWNFPQLEPNFIWLLYTFIVVRVIGIDHPPAYYEHPLNPTRKVLGWLALVIFILCFTPEPIRLVGAVG